MEQDKKGDYENSSKSIYVFKSWQNMLHKRIPRNTNLGFNILALYVFAHDIYA